MPEEYLRQMGIKTKTLKQSSKACIVFAYEHNHGHLEKRVLLHTQYNTFVRAIIILTSCSALLEASSFSSL